jgi:hypothetical protein
MPFERELEQLEKQRKWLNTAVGKSHLVLRRWQDQSLKWHWALYPPGTTPEQMESGYWKLCWGRAEQGVVGTWDRPNEQDYTLALWLLDTIFRRVAWPGSSY